MILALKRLNPTMHAPGTEGLWHPMGLALHLVDLCPRSILPFTIPECNFFLKIINSLEQIDLKSLENGSIVGSMHRALKTLPLQLSQRACSLGAALGVQYKTSNLDLAQFSRMPVQEEEGRSERERERLWQLPTFPRNHDPQSAALAQCLSPHGWCNVFS